MLSVAVRPEQLWSHNTNMLHSNGLSPGKNIFTKVQSNIGFVKLLNDDCPEGEVMILNRCSPKQTTDLSCVNLCIEWKTFD
jgi:hypothetical protein